MLLSWCPRWDSNPQKQPSQSCASTELRHLDIVVGSAGVEPTSVRGDRVQGYNLLPLPLGQLPEIQ